MELRGEQSGPNVTPFAWKVTAGFSPLGFVTIHHLVLLRALTQMPQKGWIKTLPLCAFQHLFFFSADKMLSTAFHSSIIRSEYKSAWASSVICQQMVSSGISSQTWRYLGQQLMHWYITQHSCSLGAMSEEWHSQTMASCLPHSSICLWTSAMRLATVAHLEDPRIHPNLH